MDLLHVIILSLVEGITEFLPISSTGHLILTSKILSIPTTDFLKTFEIAIQSGAVLAVAQLYWKTLLKDHSLIMKAGIGLIPTIIVGFTIYPFLKSVLLESPLITAISLITGGIIIILLERFVFKKDKTDSTELTKITYKQALLTGAAQSIAVIPGVSRSASSIFGGMLFGMNRKTATEFSFILALPTILAATTFDLIQEGPSFNSQEFMLLLVGIVLSFIVALFAIKWLLRYVSTHSFESFGWYRITIGLLFLLIFL